mmetsp:Transcript_45696/g.102989  ORF Transcript_45696/g.102989 Transcript_45696/m.102989 type:complete len:357 (+) Transcript_45696:214-1284(+)
MGVRGVRAKRSRAVAAALCSWHARRVWRRGAAGHVFGPWCACGAVQACSLACYVLHDVHGSGLSRNFGFIRLYAVSIGLCKIRRQNRVYCETHVPCFPHSCTLYSSGHCTQTHSRWNLILNGTVSALHLRMVLYLPCKLRQKRKSQLHADCRRGIWHRTYYIVPTPFALALALACCNRPGAWDVGGWHARAACARVVCWCRGARKPVVRYERPSRVAYTDGSQDSPLPQSAPYLAVPPQAAASRPCLTGVSLSLALGATALRPSHRLRLQLMRSADTTPADAASSYGLLVTWHLVVGPAARTPHNGGPIWCPEVLLASVALYLSRPRWHWRDRHRRRHRHRRCRWGRHRLSRGGGR